MAICVFCGGSGFALYEGICRECNGTGEGDFDYDAIIFEDDHESISLDELIEPKTYRQHKYNFNPLQAIE